MLREGEGFDHGLEKLVISVVSLGSFTAQNNHKSAWSLCPRNKGVRTGGRLRFLVRCHAMWVSVLGQIDLGQIDYISSVVRVCVASDEEKRLVAVDHIRLLEYGTGVSGQGHRPLW